MLRKIDFKDFKKLYRRHLIQDFPRNERPSIKSFRRRFTKNQETAHIFSQDGIDKAYIIIDDLEDYLLVAFLAVYKEYRGKGIGTELLKEIKDAYPEKKGILFEVEDPEFSSNEANKKAKERRIHFYEKSGCQIVKGIKVKIFSENYIIMTLPIKEKQNDKKGVIKAIDTFYHKVQGKRYDKIIQFTIEEDAMSK